MQEIIKEYGPALITVIAVIALATLIVVLIGSTKDSVVGEAFTNLITTFFDTAKGKL